MNFGKSLSLAAFVGLASAGFGRTPSVTEQMSRKDFKDLLEENYDAAIEFWKTDVLGEIRTDHNNYDQYSQLLLSAARFCSQNL